MTSKLSEVERKMYLEVFKDFADDDGRVDRRSAKSALLLLGLDEKEITARFNALVANKSTLEDVDNMDFEAWLILAVNPANE